MNPRSAQTALIVVGIVACALAVVSLIFGIASVVGDGGRSAVTSFLLAAVLAVLGVADLIVVARLQRQSRL